MLDAAGAEAYAFLVILRLTPFFPDTTTDCLNVVDSVKKGKAATTMARSPQARIWMEVFGIMQDMGASIEDALQQLRWMPAHGPKSSIGVALKSDLRLVSALEWRANRLVDSLAKSAADPRRCPLRHVRTVSTAAAAVTFSLCRLATVTHAANHYQVATVLVDGTMVYASKRDSAATKSSARRLQDKRTRASDETAATTGASSSRVNLARPASTRAAARKQALLDKECAEELQFWEYWRSSRSALKPAPPGDADRRLGADKDRLAAKFAARRADFLGD